MIGLKDIEIAVCTVYGLKRDQLIAVRAARHFARPRQVVMYLARKYTTSSYPRIGTYLCRDHTTVLHGERAVTRLISEDPVFASEVSECCAVLLEINRYRKMEAAQTAASFVTAREAA